MTELMQAHRQWASRAPDERFTSLLDMHDFKRRIRENSRSHVISSRRINLLPVEDDPAHCRSWAAASRRRPRIGHSGSCARSPAPATRRPATSARRTCLPR
jgi:hypothetical protein